MTAYLLQLVVDLSEDQLIMWPLTFSSWQVTHLMRNWVGDSLPFPAGSWPISGEIDLVTAYLFQQAGDPSHETLNRWQLTFSSWQLTHLRRNWSGDSLPSQAGSWPIWGAADQVTAYLLQLVVDPSEEQLLRWQLHELWYIFALAQEVDQTRHIANCNLRGEDTSQENI